VTCRDWFQLTLKEGLTVFRDQGFSADMNSAAVKRIEVSGLRVHCMTALWEEGVRAALASLLRQNLTSWDLSKSGNTGGAVCACSGRDVNIAVLSVC
jgi:hypothetical protein